jgi:hypothetical protein
MLSINHFNKEEYGRNWYKLVEDGIVIKCAVCGKWIFKNWLKGKGWNNYPDQTKCALCKWKK